MIPQLYTPSEKSEEQVCSVCKGFARFCKISTCPFYRSIFKEALQTKLSSKTFFGPSPPTVLVGEKSYPNVVLGPGVMLAENTRPDFLENPARWLDASLDELLAMRLSLFFGKMQRPVNAAVKADSAVAVLQDSAASAKTVDVEITVKGELRVLPGFGVRSAPYGPSARIENLSLVGNVSVPRKVDSYINDEVSAEQALSTLHRSGFNEYYLTRVFSAGLLGRSRERRLVPTEWSITAVDDILSKKLFEQVKHYNIISEFRVHSFSAVENSGHVLLTPTPWMYELLEGWLKHPNNPPYSDHEYLKPRTSYAENTGGAYYAVRLALLQHLSARKEQSGAVVFFEIHPGWIPLGVWRFREIVRKALAKPPEKFHELDEALEKISHGLSIPLSRYVSRSRLIPMIKKQLKIV